MYSLTLKPVFEEGFSVKNYPTDDTQREELHGFMRELRNGEESIIDLLTELDPEHGPVKKVQFATRRLPDLEPERARAAARNHEFHSLEAFCQYLDRESEESSCVVLADVDASQITAVLDESDEKDREQISFLAKIHPKLDRWQKLLGKKITVQDFALFVMENRSAVLEPNGRDLALTFSSVKASKQITKHVGIGNKSLNGIVVQLQVGSEKHDMPVELPERIVIVTPIYLDTDPVEVTLDLLVTECNDSLVVILNAPELEEAKMRVFEQMVEQVKSDTGLIVGLGKVKSRDWKTV